MDTSAVDAADRVPHSGGRFLEQQMNAMYKEQADTLSVDGTLLSRLREANKNLLAATLHARDLQSAAEIALCNQEQFLATLAHELRNPLTPILMATNALGAIDGDQAGARYRQTIARQVEHLAHLIKALDDATRIKSGKVILHTGLMQLGDALALAIEMTQPERDACQQKLVTTLSDEALVVQGDMDRLVQIFSNILINATKFTPAAGRIAVLMRRSGPAEALVCIQDSGSGVAPAFQHKMFDMFAQDGPAQAHARTGSGIGLALVQSLVELHGGRIEMKNNEYEPGSSFMVKLPLAQ